MCTETFLRLPEEKRNRFLEAAWEEFTTVPLSDASINQIVRRARIPRGSFYQYFAGKEDLFSYLQNIGIEYLVKEYSGVMKQAKGDIFLAQLMCFDRLRKGIAVDPQFERCVRAVRLNPGLLPRIAMEGKLVRCILEGVWEQMDTSAFRRKDDSFVAHTFGLTLMSLALAVVACIDMPEKVDEHRQALLMQLDIIKQGSLVEPSRTEQ